MYEIFIFKILTITFLWDGKKNSDVLLNGINFDHFFILLRLYP